MRRRSTAAVAFVVVAAAAGALGLGSPALAVTATPAPTATATAAPTSTPTATASPSAKATPAPSSSATTPAVAADPSLSTQNAEGDHAMGSTIAANEPATATPQLHSLLATPNATTSSNVYGLDVSAYQGTVNWATVKADGGAFAYMKATEGVSYTSSSFASQYSGAASAGLIRGAYVFANPRQSSGAAQADYFIAHGGGWTADGKTLPPLLDIEYDPYTGTDGTNSCWGFSASAMVSWIAAFSNEMKAKTGISPAIYSTTGWWSTCTGNSKAFSGNPLFIAHYDRPLTSGPGTLPASWSTWSIWQYADAGVFPGDQDIFNGTAAQLKGLALPAYAVTLRSSPKGAYDSATAVPGGASISGWDYDPDAQTTSIRTAVYVDGHGNKTITANSTRADVGAAYPGVGNQHGFSTTVAMTPGKHSVCVFAINVSVGSNVELGCKTVTVLGSSPIGVVDKVAGGPTSITVGGWAIDGDVTTAIPVDVYIDGRGHRITASNARSDIARLYPGYGGAHGFSAVFPVAQGAHKVCYYGITRGSAGANTLFGCSQVTVKDTPAKGHIDAVLGGAGTVSISGWAFDPDTPTAVSRVSIYVDGAGHTIDAANSRSDIARVYPAAGALHGYSASYAVRAGTHKVCAWARDTSGGANASLGCATVTSR